MDGAGLTPTVAISLAVGSDRAPSRAQRPLTEIGSDQASAAFSGIGAESFMKLFPYMRELDRGEVYALKSARGANIHSGVRFVALRQNALNYRLLKE